MRILAISNFYPPYHAGGYGQLCQWLCEGLARRGHAVRILSSRPAGPVSTKDPQGILEVDRTLRTVSSSMSPFGLLVTTIANRRAVIGAIREFRPDVVYCHGIDDVGYQVYHSAIESGIPSLTAIGDTWLAQAWRNLGRFDPWNALATGGGRPGWVRHVKRALGRTGEAAGLFVGSHPARFRPCTAISRFVADDLARLLPDGSAAIPIVPPLIGLQYFTPTGDPIGHAGGRSAALRALFVSRMEMLKGPDTAIRALASAVAAGANVTLTFAGMRQELLRPELEGLADSLHVAGRITWAGTPRAGELLELFRNHDVFLFPSRIVEGFGLVNAEAMASGMPVIGAAHSGSSDIITDGGTGFRVDAADFAAIGHYLTRLHDDRALLERLAANAIERARRHHPDAVISQVEVYLRHAIEGC